MEFMLGCNYWASNAGAEMWKSWDPIAVEKDLQILSAHGVTHLRVFPNWRDFQPVIPIMVGQAQVKEYRLEDESFVHNPYYLDETMLNRFDAFCDLCEKYGMKLIVGLLTGWMSGRTYIPMALVGRNLFTDPLALLFSQKFIAGFIRTFKHRDIIIAWDLGNECNCMSPTLNTESVENWTSVISNAIRANDPTRPVVSGMHSLTANGEKWSMQAQGEYTDILTTHPYPYWSLHAKNDRICSYRTTMNATCQSQLYTDIGGKPCLVEEIGTMGPMVCSEENASIFFRCNAYSAYINNQLGILWWCANEQTNLTTHPYTNNMCEVELGMIDANGNPKPVLKEMKRFSSFLSTMEKSLPAIKADAVCILTQDQDQWGVAYMAYCLAKQCNIHLRFVYCNQPLPEADVYMLPSLCAHNVMPAETYHELLNRVSKGARLYISNDYGFLSEFNRLAGVVIEDSAFIKQTDSIDFMGENITFTRNKCTCITPNGASVLASDSEGNPAIIENQFGEGTVFYVNFPLESMLLNESHAFEGNRYLIYKYFFRKEIESKKVFSSNNKIVITEHRDETGTYIAVLSHSPESQKTDLVFNGCEVDKILYGNPEQLEPYEATIFTIR